MINENQKDWIFLEIKINLPQFLIKFKSVSNFYRLLSNGNYLFNRKPNRVFFKTNFYNGFYRSSIIGDRIKLVFLLKSQEKLINERLILELKIRIKKLMYCDVNVDDLNGMDEVDRILLNSVNGINFYQKILGSYTG
ncbi:MAG: hypothetical protein EBR24_07730 [Flavobacteriia bacterium]|jgi:hypothetical protein|nr:hypothetical protein [Flavobacteriia bacterium]